MTVWARKNYNCNLASLEILIKIIFIRLTSYVFIHIFINSFMQIFALIMLDENEYQGFTRSKTNRWKIDILYFGNELKDNWDSPTPLCTIAYSWLFHCKSIQSFFWLLASVYKMIDYFELRKLCLNLNVKIHRIPVSIYARKRSQNNNNTLQKIFWPGIIYVTCLRSIFYDQ